MHDTVAEELIRSQRELALACRQQVQVTLANMRQRWTLKELCDRYSRSDRYMRQILKDQGFTTDHRTGDAIRLHIRDVLRLDRVMDAIDAGETNDA